MRCLAVDVGNTSAALGIVSGKSVRHVRHINGGLNNFDELDGALTELMKQGSIDGVILCSVVPSANRLWCKLLRRHTSCEPIVVSHTINLGVKIDYPKPESIGPDRLANACGAIAKFGAPAIVADFGTALTFDVIDSSSTYIGGVIAPGLPLMTEYLADRTELLPLINLKGRCAKVGRSTESAMRIGAHVGYRGMVREIVEHLKQNLGPSPVALCATGGFARWILSDTDMPFVVEPNLTLYGLGKIFELNGDKT